MAVLKISGLSKSFGIKTVFENVSFEVRSGERIGLVGANGAGKTTLMNILYGLYRQDAGEIFWCGKPAQINKPGEAIQLGIGMVHQHFMLVEAMTVFENMILGDRNSKGIFIDREARRKEILALSEKYGLDVELDKLITEISVGAQLGPEAADFGRAVCGADGDRGRGSVRHHEKARQRRKIHHLYQPQDA